ncbi:hypothetical protein BHM03_00029870 [Ensete ventricosum]|nr:hypothetical protein BHM03_00029870 [Ensete ventricosum]
MRTARYRAVQPKIDRRRSISAVGGRLKGEIDCRRSIEREKGRKKRKKKKKKRKEEKKNTYRPRAVLARASSPLRVVAARGLPAPACHRRPRALFRLHGEKDRGDIAREVLDAAARIIRPGITTDEIDEVVHQATIAAALFASGVWRDRLWPDGWTAVTSDGKRSAQFEHTLLVSGGHLIVTETGVEVLTARLPSSPKVFPWLNS